MKKAILVISFGTSHLDTLQKTIEKVEGDIKKRFEGEYEVIRAFTAHKIIKKLKEKHGLEIQTPEEALEMLSRDNFEEVVIQPLHLIAGEEFDYIKKVTKQYEDKFKSLILSRPMLYFECEEERTRDYSNLAKALKEFLPKKENYILIGHGTNHPAGASYGCLQNIFADNDMDNFFVGTVEGYPSYEVTLKRLKKANAKNVLLIPLLLVAGDHAKNDIAGDDEDSWKSMLLEEGFNVEVFLHGLGEFDEISKLYLNHLEDAMSMELRGLGETKKGVK